MYTSYLAHHGILGQKWGKRNGPPYPLKGGSYTRTEQQAIKAARKKKYSRYNKKHYDEVLEKGTVLKTLSYDPNRTANTDMFFASHTKTDVDHYKEFFDKKAPMPIYDDNGNNVGTGMCYKYSIQNKAKKDMRVASEDSGAKAFKRLYESDRDFYNFVTNPDRLRALYEDSVRSVTPSYRKAQKVMDKMKSPDYTPTDKELDTAYRIFNYSIPNDGGNNARKAKDVTTQRAKFFNQLKNDGYDAVLDTNDALYNRVNAQSPIIVFNMEAIVPEGAYRTSMSEVYKSKALTVGRRLIGIM